MVLYVYIPRIRYITNDCDEILSSRCWRAEPCEKYWIPNFQISTSLSVPSKKKRLNFRIVFIVLFYIERNAENISRWIRYAIFRSEVFPPSGLTTIIGVVNVWYNRFFYIFSRTTDNTDTRVLNNRLKV